MSIEVLEPGGLTTVQDTLGRSDWRHLGVPEGGAADRWSARLANRLVGNPDEAPLLELTWHGPTLRFDAAVTVAFVGGFQASLDALPLPTATARRARAGSVLQVGPGVDLRGYLAFGGGLAVKPLLGSAATELRSGFGGIDGRPLRAGDRLELASSEQLIGRRWVGVEPAGPVRILEGPHGIGEITRVLTHARWRVAEASDRTGVRLDGLRLPVSVGEVASVGLPLGAIQVPPDGRPIVMLADRPVTGGYPVPAVVIGADIGRVARLRPGSELRFASVSLEEARSALRAITRELAALEVLDAPGDDELGWAGSHR